MLDFPWAHSAPMQLALCCTQIASAVLIAYYIANLSLLLYGSKAGRMRKLLFALVAGIAQHALIYLPVSAATDAGFMPLAYALIVTPNPLFAVLFLFIGAWILRLAPSGSVRIMRPLYLFVMATFLIDGLVHSALFADCDPRAVNALRGVASVGIGMLADYALYRGARRVARRFTYLLRLPKHGLSRSLTRDIAMLFIHTCLIYAYIVLIEIYAQRSAAVYALLLISALLALLLTILAEYLRAARVVLENKDAYITTLSTSVDDFAAIKNDIYGILHNYSDFMSAGAYDRLKEYHESLLGTTLAAGDQLDLHRHMERNPTLVSLLLKKSQYAKENGVAMRITLLCDVSQMYIDALDLSRIVGNLLDNAIEAACECEHARVSLSIEQKTDGSRLVVVSNTTKSDISADLLMAAPASTKQGHGGRGISQVRTTIAKYTNCRLSYGTYNREVTAYLELRAA